MKKIVSPVTMFLFGVVAFIAIMIITVKLNLSSTDATFWSFRVLTALAASAISISIPGMLEVNFDKDGNEIQAGTSGNKMSFAEKEPTVTASGAIAVFVLVYLFNPLI